MVRALVAVVVALALGLAALEAVRARLESSDDLRESLEGAASAQLGLVLTTGDLEVSFWPPELRLGSPVLEQGGVRIELPETRIEIDLARLMEDLADVRSLAAAGPVKLSHVRGQIEGTLDLELIPGEPPSSWIVDARVELEPGGLLAALGPVAQGGGFAGRVEIDDVEGAPFGAFLSGEGGEAASVTGRYSGQLDLSEADGPTTLRLASEQTIVEIAPIRLEGPVALVAEMPAALSSSPEGGRFAVDASRATVEYAGTVAAASGRGASLTGEILREKSGRIRLADVRLKVQRFQGEVTR